MTELKFNDQGLIPAIVQDEQTKQVLMMAWMSPQALQLTKQTKEAHFWSRSRQVLWHKGSTSGNIMNVNEILFDCDGDTILLMVTPAGPACHTGAVTCFHSSLEDDL